MPVNFLRKIRKERELRLADISRKTGISSQSLSNFENGRSNLSIKNANSLINYLGITYETLFGEIGEEETISTFTKENKDLLAKAMKIAKDRTLNLSEEKLIDLSTTIYSILLEFNSAYNQEVKEKFIKKMEAKSMEGIAAKLFLEDINLKPKEIIVPQSFHYDKNDSSFVELDNKKTG